MMMLVSMRMANESGEAQCSGFVQRGSASCECNGSRFFYCL